MSRRKVLSIGVAGALFVGLECSPASAHGTAIYVSTPVSPPTGFIWVPLVFLVMIVSVDAVIGWRLLRAGEPLLCAGRSFLWIVVFVLCFLLIGGCAAKVHTGPPPGLGPPERPFYGLGWQSIGALFATWNLIGLGFLSLFTLRMARGFGKSRLGTRRVLWAANVLVYVVCLVPYAATGALTHGWFGSYSHGRCGDQLRDLADALARYAEAHEGQLPPGRTLDKVHVDISPYLKGRGGYRGIPNYVCPIGGTRHKYAKPYVWNAELASKSFGRGELYSLPEGTPVFTCPYHERAIEIDWFRMLYRYPTTDSSDIAD